jgi:hypothetical protein
MEKNSDIDLLSAEQGDESQHEALLRSAKNREERSFLTALVVYVSVLSVSTEFNRFLLHHCNRNFMLPLHLPPYLFSISYLLYFAVYAGVFLGIAHFRTRLPAPLSAADADPTHAFAGMRAWDRLVAFTQQPHAFNAEVRERGVTEAMLFSSCFIVITI